jgi:hypothetical protein
MRVPKISRTAASTFDPELFEEVQTAIGLIGGEKDSGVPEDFDDELLGQNAKDEAEKNYQRGQEMAILVSMTGWGYAKDSLRKMVDETKKAHDAAVSDAEILLTHREWKAMEKAVTQIISNVEMAATVPPPDTLEN